MKQRDIIIRDCGRVGFLGIIEESGKEIYRTGSHWPTSSGAFYQVCDWLDQQE